MFTWYIKFMQTSLIIHLYMSLKNETIFSFRLSNNHILKYRKEAEILVVTYREKCEYLFFTLYVFHSLSQCNCLFFEHSIESLRRIGAISFRLIQTLTNHTDVRTYNVFCKLSEVCHVTYSIENSWIQETALIASRTHSVCSNDFVRLCDTTSSS